ncbi:MAG: hypothetical protein U1F37_15815 [Alphaproteobacteria bacterium]
MPTRAALSRISPIRFNGMAPRSFQPCTVPTAIPSALAIGRMPPKAAMMRSASFGVLTGSSFMGLRSSVSAARIAAISASALGRAARRTARNVALPSSAAATARERQ